MCPVLLVMSKTGFCFYMFYHKCHIFALFI
nr:MAG TPA: hypothetical protein [Caudoviricetes sp.]